MARRTFIKQGSAFGGTVNVDIPKGRYAGLLVRVYGTTAATQTLALADIGQMRLKRYGEEVISETFDFFHAYDDLKSGFLPTVSGGAAAAEDIFAMIPLSLPELPNTADVQTDTEMDLTLVFSSAMDTRFSGSTVTYQVYGYITDDIPEQYQLMIREQDVEASAAGRKVEVLNGVNLAALYLTDVSDIVDKYSLAVDGLQVVDDIDDDVERAITGMENRVESATTFAEVNLVHTGNPANARNSQAKVNLTFNAAGTVTLTAFQIMRSKRATR